MVPGLFRRSGRARRLVNAEQELVFAKHLVEVGVAPAQAVKECLRVQAARSAEGRASPLAGILVERGLLTETALESRVRHFELHLGECIGLAGLSLQVANKTLRIVEECTSNLHVFNVLPVDRFDIVFEVKNERARQGH